MKSSPKTRVHIPAELGPALGPLRRRAYLDSALRWALLALTAWGAATALVLAWSKLSPTANTGIIAGALGACAVLGAVAGWAVQRPSPLQVARVADARLGLHERLASALYFASEPDDMHRRLRADAAKRAKQHRPADAFPLRRHGRRALALGASAAVVAALAFTPNPQASALARRSADQAVLSQARKTVVTARKHLGRQARKGNDGKEAAKAQQELQQALLQLQRARTPLQALVALSALQNELASLPNLSSQDLAAAAAAGAALDGAPGAGKLAQALSKGDLKAAAQDLRQLARSISGLSPAEQQALAKALQQAAQQAAATQSAAGGAQGQGAQGSTSASGTSSLASGLAQAAQALASGKTGSASQDLGSAANGASASAKAASLQQELAAVEAAVHNSQSEVAAQAQADSSGHGAKLRAAGRTARSAGKGGAVSHYATGSGQGKSSGKGAVAGRGQGVGAGSGSGNGSGSGKGGTGAGGGNGSGNGAGNRGRASNQVFVGGQPASTEQVVGKQLSNGYRVKTTNYQKVLPSFQKTALQGLGSQVVSPADQDLVRSYFSSLSGSGQPGAGKPAKPARQTAKRS